MEVLHGLHLRSDMYLKKNNFFLALFLLTLYFPFFSCSDDHHDPLDWQFYTLEPNYSIRSFEQQGDIILAFGGMTWSKGIHVTLDEADILIDSIASTIILDSYLKNDTVAVCGPYFVQSSVDLINWNSHELLDFDISRSCIHIENQILSVGGLGFDFGTIYRHNFLDNGIDRTTNDNSLEKLVFHQGRLIALGFGIILTSIDYGSSWITTPLEGGHFVEAIIKENDLYVLDAYGNLLVTDIGMNEWKNEINLESSDLTDFIILDSGEVIFANLNGELKQYSESEGIKSIASFDHAVYSLYFHDQHLYVGGDGGLLARAIF